MNGIYTETPPQKYPFNRKNSIILIIISIDVIFSIKYLDEAETFEEYTNVLYGIILMFNFIVIFLKIVWKSSELLNFIDNLENTINNSE